MMNEAFATGFQFGSQFAQVRFDHLAVCVYKRIETEHEIDRGVGNHRQRTPIIEVTAHMRINSETLTAGFDTFLGAINDPQLLAIIFEVVRPPPKTRRNFQNRPGWQAISNTRKDGTGPL